MTLYDATATPLADVIGDRIPRQPPTYTAARPIAPFLIGQQLPSLPVSPPSSSARHK
jgi:hypothetical protein